MPRQFPVLDYAPSPPSRVRKALVTIARFLHRLFRRPLSAAEVAGGGWLLVCLATFWITFGNSRAWPGFHTTDPDDSVLYVFALTLAPIAACAMAGLAIERRWRRLLQILAVGLPLAIVCGVIQIKSCPHTPWLQVMGVSFPLDGRGCGNAQAWFLWWY